LKSLLGKEYIIEKEVQYSEPFPEIEKGDKMDLLITDKDGKKMASKRYNKQRYSMLL